MNKEKNNHKIIAISLWAMAYGVFWASLINDNLFNFTFGIIICLMSLYYYFKYKKELK